MCVCVCDLRIQLFSIIPCVRVCMVEQLNALRSVWHTHVAVQYVIYRVYWGIIRDRTVNISKLFEYLAELDASIIYICYFIYIYHICLKYLLYLRLIFEVSPSRIFDWVRPHSLPLCLISNSRFMSQVSAASHYF